MKTKTRSQLLLALLMLTLVSTPTFAAVTLRNICRIKGQEENTIRGLGLVVGLNGTGETNDPATMRALARALEIMGSVAPQTGMPGEENLREFQRIKNVALVWVTATIPATGARSGDKLNCTVSAINGKSLVGGSLAVSALIGPSISDSRVYGMANGAIHLDSLENPLSGSIHMGCQMVMDVFTPFEKDGKVTFVLDENHASFLTAAEVVRKIRQMLSYPQEDPRVKALNAANIQVVIPPHYASDPVDFISEALDLPIYNPSTEARVVINERTGSIVIHGDVQIGDIVVSHRNIVVEANENTPRFVELRDGEETSPKLRALVNALNALRVPNADAIEIIKDIERAGKLHAKLIIH